jgi:hypothetical protein
MAVLRRFVLLLLLLTVPFQAALGATGLLCAAGAHHSEVAASATHNHDRAAAGHAHHGSDASGAHQHAGIDSGAHDSHGASGKCEICSECCSASAAIPAALPTVFPPDTPLRVSSIVEPGRISRTGDGLFRPPRTPASR